MTESSPNPDQVPGSSSKWMACCGFGCLGIIVLSLGLGVAGYFWFQKQLEFGVENYTSEEPEVIVAPDVEKAQIDDSINRYDSFQQALSSGEAPNPQVFTADDINALIFNHPDFEDLQGQVAIEMEGELLKSRVSVDLEALDIPIKFIADQVKGRYFNGEASFKLFRENGRPALYLEGMEMNGASLPQAILNEFKSENLLSDYESTPEVKAFFENISDFKVENGKLIVIPK